MADFEEEWSKIKNGVLTIKWYYFPTSQNLRLKCEKIKRITIACQSKSYAKNWGANEFAWWACDMKRNFRSKPEEFYNVRIDVGGCFQKGFTVHDLVSFLQVIRKNSEFAEIIFE